MDPKTYTAQEAARRAEKMIDAMWNSSNVRTRLAMRQAFYGVKPNPAEFFANISIWLLSKKDPEA